MPNEHKLTMTWTVRFSNSFSGDVWGQCPPLNENKFDLDIQHRNAKRAQTHHDKMRFHLCKTKQFVP